MKICIAQTKSIIGDISKNIEKHEKLIQVASAQSISAIFFPELSITGYEPTLAKVCATNLNDVRFDVFQALSDTRRLTIAVGVPILTDTGILISMLIFQPHESRRSYSKQQLHSDEFPYFVAGNKQTIITVDNVKIAPAICYESLQMIHSDYACGLGTEIYMASVAKTQNGIDKGMVHYPAVAKKHSVPVLMVNCIGFCDNSMCVGKSAVWNKDGVLIGQLSDESEGLLIFDTETEEVFQQSISQ